MVYPALLEKEYILCMSERQILEGLKSQAVMGGHCLLLKTEFKKRSFPFFSVLFPCTYFIQLHIPIATYILLPH